MTTAREVIEALSVRENAVRYITTLQNYYDRFRLDGTPEGIFVQDEINKVKQAYAQYPSVSGAMMGYLTP